MKSDFIGKVGMSVINSSDLINPPNAKIAILPCKVAVDYVFLFHRLDES